MASIIVFWLCPACLEIIMDIYQNKCEILLQKAKNITKKLFLSEEVQKHKEALRSSLTIDTSQITVDKLVGSAPFPNINLGADVYTDIEMFTTYRDIPSATTIFKSIDKTYTIGGSIWLKNVLSSPTADISELETRQQNLVTFQTFSKYSSKVAKLFTTLKATESDVLWFFSATEEELRYLYDIVYFQSLMLAPLNRSKFALTAYNIYRIIISPITGILSPIIYFVIPYLVLIFKYNIKIGFFQYLSFTVKSLILGSDILTHLNGSFAIVKYLSMITTALFYFQNIFNSIDLSSLLWKLVTKIYKHTNNVIEFINSSKELLGIYGHVPTLDSPLRVQSAFLSCFLFDHFGRQLNYFKQCSRPQLHELLKQIYEIDYKTNLLNLLGNGFSLPTYVKSDRPTISAQGIWHPSLAPYAVPNNLTNLQNTIITGPNAGGKSTLLKAVLTNIVLAQTIGVVSAKEFILSPFKYISSQISIPDCKGKESLFQAEMYRCKEKLDIVRTLPENDFMFIAMDEIFNSTNPLEGISGAFAVLKKLAEYPNAIVMITTHFLYLTKLKEHGFVCKKMNVIQEHGKPITFPYKMENGISRQHVALELLAANGFDDDILQTALEVKNKLSEHCVQKHLKEM